MRGGDSAAEQNVPDERTADARGEAFDVRGAYVFLNGRRNGRGDVPKRRKRGGNGGDLRGNGEKSIKLSEKAKNRGKTA